MWFLSTRRPVGCLGKVPFSPDYDLEARLGGEAEEALGEWLHAIPKPVPGAGHFPQSGPAEGYAFLLREAGRRRAIAGRLWPSSDSAGRSFPFAVYIGLGRKELQGGLGATVERLEPAWKALEFMASDGGQYWTEIRHSSTMGLAGARDRLLKAKIPHGEWIPSLPGDIGRRTRELGLGPFLSTLFPGDTPARSGATFLSLARFLRNLDGVEKPRFAILAPFGQGLPEVLQLTFWIEWINRRRRTEPALMTTVLDDHFWIEPISKIGGTLLPEAVFLPRGPGGCLLLVFRDLMPQDGEPLLYGRPPHEYLLDLTGRIPAAEQDLAVQLRLGERLLALKTVGDLLGLGEELVEGPVRG